MLQHCKTQWSFPEAESSSPWLHAALPSAILQHYCNFTVGDSDSADSPPPKKKLQTTGKNFDSGNPPKTQKKHLELNRWDHRMQRDVLKLQGTPGGDGEIFRSKPGTLVSWLSWLIRGAARIFKKKKSQGRHLIFLVFSGKDFCFFLGGLFGGTYMDGSPKKPPMYPVTLRKIVDYNHISPEKSRR